MESKIKKVFINLSYLNMILMQIFVIAGVVILFKLISDRKMASIFASLLFIILSAMLCYAEFHRPKKWKNPLFITAGFFLFFIAIPLAATRFYHWDSDFSELKIWWIDGPRFHHISNYFFILMVISTVWNLVVKRKSHS